MRTFILVVFWMQCMGLLWNTVGFVAACKLRHTGKIALTGAGMVIGIAMICWGGSLLWGNSQ